VSQIALKRFMAVAMLLGMGLGLWAQAPAPGPSERELQAPMVLDDGKPTQTAPGESTGPSLWRALGSMVLVAGLAGGGLWAFRRWGANKLPGTRRRPAQGGGDPGPGRPALRRHPEGGRGALPHRLSPRTEPHDPPGQRGGGRPGRFDQALERQVNLTTPMAVRDMEAMLQQERP